MFLDSDPEADNFEIRLPKSSFLSESAALLYFFMKIRSSFYVKLITDRQTDRRR